MDRNIDTDEHHGKQDMPETILPLEDIIMAVKENLPLPAIEKILKSVDHHMLHHKLLKLTGFDVSRGIADDLFSAAACGDLVCIQKFSLKYGAERVMRLKSKKSECSILHCASSRGQYEMCDYLISTLGFDVNARDIQGNTPLHHAVVAEIRESGRFPKKYLTEDISYSETVGDKMQTIKILVHLNADVNAFNEAEHSVLHFAADTGDIDAIGYLIKHGCQDIITYPTTDFGTPLRSAAAMGHDGALDLLLSYKADANIVPDGCLSPLLVAIRNCHERCAIKLILGNANINYEAQTTTPLTAAILLGCKKIVNTLLDHGVETNCQDSEYGLTPLELAAWVNNNDMVVKLFPKTSPIKGIEDWSVPGVMAHCNSDEFEMKLDMRSEARLPVLLSEWEKAYEAKKFFSAMTWASMIMSLDKDHASLYARMSLCYAGLKHSQAAVDDAFRCITLNENSPLVWYASGVAFDLRKQFRSAARSFEKAWKLGDHNQKYEDAMRHAVKNLLKSDGLL